ncbi:MAG: hypothetical protein JNJ77_00325 [Planctomycetia bacterium]|nr:hypothetical protein [Planctomycetia bacterium]
MTRKSFLLRLDPALLAALQRWAEQDLRSLNGQIEYLLRQAVVKQGIKIQEVVESQSQGDVGVEPKEDVVG